MLSHRVIPTLLLTDGKLVKTERFKTPKYVGDPINTVRIFNEKEVDEIIIVDILASKRNTRPDFDLLGQIVGECFMPVCYGGGIRSLEDAKTIISLGVEKICIQGAAIDNPGFISELSATFGSQAVVVSIDVRRDWLSRYVAQDSRDGSIVSRDINSLIDHLVSRGAGEILLNSVDRDGTRSGFDCALIQKAAHNCPVPLIALGGASSVENLRDAVLAGANATAASSLFVFEGPYRAVLISYPQYHLLESLLCGQPK